MRKSHIVLYLSLLGLLIVSCETVNDDRIPNMVVNVSLADAGVWNTYGVSGFGNHRNFIFNGTVNSIPTNFPYKYGSATGFGGVLLIEGADPYSAVTASPLAYDLACPVERKPDIRVYVENETYMAVCPECNSVYNVTTAGGVPISGEAAEGKYKYRLRMYSVVPTSTGGYIITN